ncbi:hypothetical protein BT63DRAFT_413041 [Microthyrium microscopicum]|uniref:Uncharacterized protein n=1 Tax=Microthyrium microscopicum TaxID=703497 RepID=A0A6A6UDR7_9PEZI|nr:hypothetical protein BT63DRAFT_413041 [Microthyrium microscopicum]
MATVESLPAESTSAQPIKTGTTSTSPNSPPNPQTLPTPPPTDASDCGCGPPTTAPVTNHLPDASTTKTILSLPITDAQSIQHTLQSHLSSTPAAKHLLIFVRHFYCYNCQEFLRHLVHHIPQLPANTAITIISNGAPALIEPYIAATQVPYPVFVDPAPSPLYKALGLASTKSMGAKSEYVQQGLLAGVVQGVLQGVGSGKHATSGGAMWQVGGEFLFERNDKTYEANWAIGKSKGEKVEQPKEAGDEWEITWAHRMKTTRDHVSMEELRRVLGVDASAVPVEDRKSGWSEVWRSWKAWHRGFVDKAEKNKGPKPPGLFGTMV